MYVLHKLVEAIYLVRLRRVTLITLLVVHHYRRQLVQRRWRQNSIKVPAGACEMKLHGGLKQPRTLAVMIEVVRSEISQATSLCCTGPHRRDKQIHISPDWLP